VADEDGPLLATTSSSRLDDAMVFVSVAQSLLTQ
jgi:hypothetical protein